MATSEQYLELFQKNMCNVELLCLPGTVDTDTIIGVRVRPWDKRNKDRMILAQGETVDQALGNAAMKARAGRWEALDFAKRPWSVSRPASVANWSTGDDESDGEAF